MTGRSIFFEASVETNMETSSWNEMISYETKNALYDLYTWGDETQIQRVLTAMKTESTASSKTQQSKVVNTATTAAAAAPTAAQFILAKNPDNPIDVDTSIKDGVDEYERTFNRRVDAASSEEQLRTVNVFFGLPFTEEKKRLIQEYAKSRSIEPNADRRPVSDEEMLAVQQRKESAQEKREYEKQTQKGEERAKQRHEALQQQKAEFEQAVERNKLEEKMDQFQNQHNKILDVQSRDDQLIEFMKNANIHESNFQTVREIADSRGTADEVDRTFVQKGVDKVKEQTSPKEVKKKVKKRLLQAALKPTDSDDPPAKTQESKTYRQTQESGNKTSADDAASREMEESGDKESGDKESGDKESGNKESGDKESGNKELGDKESVDSPGSLEESGPVSSTEEPQSTEIKNPDPQVYKVEGTHDPNQNTVHNNPISVRNALKRLVVTVGLGATGLNQQAHNAINMGQPTSSAVQSVPYSQVDMGQSSSMALSDVQSQQNATGSNVFTFANDTRNGQPQNELSPRLESSVDTSKTPMVEVDKEFLNQFASTLSDVAKRKVEEEANEVDAETETEEYNMLEIRTLLEANPYIDQNTPDDTLQELMEQYNILPKNFDYLRGVVTGRGDRSLGPSPPLNIEMEGITYVEEEDDGDFQDPQPKEHGRSIVFAGGFNTTDYLDPAYPISDMVEHVTVAGGAKSIFDKFLEKVHAFYKNDFRVQENVKFYDSKFNAFRTTLLKMKQPTIRERLQAYLEKFRTK